MKHTLRKILKTFGYDLVPSHVIPFDLRQMDNFSLLERMYASVSTIDGAIVECGVGRGRTFLYLAALLWREKKNRTLWGFDSFAGFPEPDPKDTSMRNPKKGEWAGTSPEDIKKVLLRAGLPVDFVQKNIKLVKGFFATSLKKYDGRLIAFLHLDADLYQSYKVVLEMLFPRIAEGGIVLFDEYGEENWPGAKKAADEYFSGTGYQIARDVSGKYFVRKTIL